jgi:hypothetical protein
MSSEAVVVESGIPLAHNSRKHGFPYPFEGMKNGDSFFIPLDGCRAQTVQSRINAAVTRWRKKDPELNDSRFTTRSVVENDIEGIRVWKVY